MNQYGYSPNTYHKKDPQTDESMGTRLYTRYGPECTLRTIEAAPWWTNRMGHGPDAQSNFAFIMDPDPERSQEEVPDDASQPSYREEERISEASNTLLPSRRRHWMDTRLRMHIPEIPISPLPAKEALFSENEAVPDPGPSTPNPPKRMLIDCADISLACTSAPQLTNPSLTDMLSNFPIWPQIDHQSHIETNVSEAESPKPDVEEEPLSVAVMPATTTTAASNHVNAQKGQQN